MSFNFLHKLKKTISLILWFIALFTCHNLIGQTDNSSGKIKGIVKTETGELLIGANVIIKENNFGSSTNQNGEFYFTGLSVRNYTVSVSYVGFVTEIKKVTVYKSRTTEIKFILKSKSFNIGSIEVVGEKEFIPIEPETKTKITSGEIEHIQAASLNDVLELMPGVSTTNPTLNNVEQASIRGGNSIGTQILIDDVPVSNLANMQSGIGYSTVNGGVDLRSIPAENIKSVEILRGIPSVKYGDLIDGAIIVTSNVVPSSLRAKLKYNPNVYETNLSGGIRLFDNWVLNGSFNLASSDRNVKIEGDGYTRIATQLNLMTSTENYEISNHIYYTRSFDEMKEQPGYALREAWYNRDATFKYTSNYNFIFNSLSKLKFTFSANYTKRNSYKQELISRDNIVISDRITEGSQEGRFVFGTYLGKKWIKGNEWNFYADLNYEKGFFTGDYLHKLLMGVNWKNDFNNGDGVIFNPLFPPSLSYNTPRLRSYNDLPAYNTLSFYFEDKIVGRIFKPFTLQLGFRYEVYRPSGINLEGLIGKGDFIESHNGSFFNPRLNFSYNLFEDTQLRLGYGVTSKSPPMGLIFADNSYYDIADTASVVDPLDPNKNFSIVSTYIRKVANENLKGYKQHKYEASLDQRIGNFGFTLTAFLNKTYNQFSLNTVPFVLYKKSFPNWPNSDDFIIKEKIFNSYPKAYNIWDITTKGIEFSFKIKKIPKINTIFRFDAAYLYNKSETNSYNYGSARYVKSLGQKVKPRYNPRTSSSDNLLLNYRFEIQSKSLGMWVTIHIQQNYLKTHKYLAYDTLAAAYFTENNELINIPIEERNSEKYKQLRKSVEDYQLNDERYPNLWLFNLKVSKSLWKGAAISFFVNNFLNNNPLYKSKRSAPNSKSYRIRNPEIFYGMEFQTNF